MRAVFSVVVAFFFNRAASAEPPPPFIRGAGEDDNHKMMWFQWAVMMFGVCLATISAAVQALQSSTPLSLSSQFVYAGLVVFSAAVLVAIYIRPDHHRASAAVMHLAVFLGATALMLALVVNLSITFMVICVTVYIVGLVTIVFIKMVNILTTSS